MIKVRFSAEDVKSQKLLDPGKYGFVVTSIKQGVTKEKKATKWTWVFTGFTGAAKDVPVIRIYTEEYQEFMLALLTKGFGLEFSEEDGGEIDLEALKGRKIWLVTTIGEFGGSKRNEMAGFAPWEDGGPEETEALQAA